MRRRTFILLAGSSAALGGCGEGFGPGYYPGAGPVGLGAGPAAPSSAGSVGVLLPLSGARAGIAQPMLQGAQLALAQPGSPPPVQQDTGGTPQGAAAAARAALGAGARILLGPLTAPEVQAAAPVAQQAQVPMLAFSNDPAVARPGVWPLGITPGEQVRRLVVAAQQAGKTQFAALLPDNAFGRAMGDALGTAATQSGMSPPRIQYHGPGMSSINQAARAVSDYEARWGPIEQQIKQARAEGTPEGARRAAQLGKSTPPPPPFDALLLGDVGEALVEVAAVLPYYFVFQPAVQFMGPSLWADPSSRASGLRGAWFAAPEPGARSAFVDTYSARYGAPPPFVADIAYDAAAIARVTAESGYSVQALTNPNGFSGADGLVVLLPSGEVRRGLALWQIQAGGAQAIQPAAPLGA